MSVCFYFSIICSLQKVLKKRGALSADIIVSGVDSGVSVWRGFAEHPISICHWVSVVAPFHLRKTAVLVSVPSGPCTVGYFSYA